MKREEIKLAYLAVFKLPYENKLIVFFIYIYFYDFFPLSVDSQDIQVVSSAFVTTYTKEYTGTFGQPAPNARYQVHTVLLAREKRARKSCV